MPASALETTEAPTEPPEAARAAGLRYTSDRRPGIERRRNGSGFVYVGPDRNRITDPETLVRIKSLAIPPAWTDVWISPIANGHLQATGRDARGRKQYRYHERWREVRDETKYHRTTVFARALPAIRRRVDRDLASPGLPREKVVAAVVRLLDVSNIRVGNPEYARDNGSYGLTTLRGRHVKVSGERMRFSFRGKGGKRTEVAVEDRRVARIVQRCRDLPGQELFQYVGDDGQPVDVGSSDVNDYLLAVAGQDFTSKDFRTWSGTVLAAEALARMGEFRTQRQARSKIVRAVEEVSEELGNTPAVCRKCYVHPDVIEAYLDGTLHDYLDPGGPKAEVKRIRGLRVEEARVLALLRDRSRAARRKAA
ncbi:MAG TPA: DNA topoisomerase IB [Actinomycetota bacterium]|nr:DNA topoisomerase IB [Actinomycetota bacterium]